MTTSSLSYNPKTCNKRELAPFYIPTTDSEIKQMLKASECSSLEDLYSHIPSNYKFTQKENFIDPIVDYEKLQKHLEEIAQMNETTTSLIGDGLTHYCPSPIVSDICAIRGLTTAYTPYQPEKSQGTLRSLWIYQSMLSELTGFEAVNASLYDRSTGIFESIKVASRMSKNKSKKILIIDSLFENDKEVLNTLIKHTNIEIDYIPLSLPLGRANIEALQSICIENYCALVFSQTTSLGTLEDVDLLTDFCEDNKLVSIAVVDPILLSNGGLKKPVHFGTQAQGVDIITGEAQSLSIDKNFGGPGLGLFGVRYNEETKLNIRHTPGRFVGKASDIKGNECEVLILSTREQHIRKEKATSNICSNQSFLATLAGANLLYWGDSGLSQKIKAAKSNCDYFLSHILKFQEIDLAYQAPYYNEVSLKFSKSLDEVYEACENKNIELGVKLGHDTLKLFFNDELNRDDFKEILEIFENIFTRNKEKEGPLPTIESKLLSQNDVQIKSHPKEEVIAYYQMLGSLNFSPDDGVYPLGSCTMKYNPFLNDYSASLDGFTKTHPQTNLKFAQGNLKILYEIQEFFRKLTGLAAVTTQPVAGAQGELVGLKMFQAYHADKGETRKYILIPRSAHGTNPATANVAGYEILYLEANQDGQVDMESLSTMIQTHGKEIAAIMITNPNTSGIFETKFREISDKIHAIDALVYMDGANMNAIAGHIDLNKLGVDAVHNNLHKTWTIPHGGGGPGDAIVAVSEKLVDYMPGKQITSNSEGFSTFIPSKSIGSFHRHWGNFAHKIRCYTYIKSLGSDGVRKMSACATLSSRYLFSQLKSHYPILPANTEDVPRMHEFIITITDQTFKNIESVGLKKSQVIGRIGKLFLDFGFHAPTVSFPEVYGLMIEPTESYNVEELDRFAQAVIKIGEVINNSPEVLLGTPYFTPISRVDELRANKKPIVHEAKKDGTLFNELPKIAQPIENDDRFKSLNQIKIDLEKAAHQADLG